MITFLFSIDVKKQSSMGLFFFYPNLSEFLCNRFRKGAQPNGNGQKRYFICGHVLPFLTLQANYIIYENCLLGSQRKRQETIETTMYNQT